MENETGNELMAATVIELFRLDGTSRPTSQATRKPPIELNSNYPNGVCTRSGDAFVKANSPV